MTNDMIDRGKKFAENMGEQWAKIFLDAFKEAMKSPEITPHDFDPNCPCCEQEPEEKCPPQSPEIRLRRMYDLEIKRGFPIREVYEKWKNKTLVDEQHYREGDMDWRYKQEYVDDLEKAIKQYCKENK